MVGYSAGVVTIGTEDPAAVSVVDAIHRGDVSALRELLGARPELAMARLGDEDPDGMSRTLLHVATDWPGHFPNGSETVRLLVAAGADVNARFRGPHEETPLHWAASSDDVAVLDALLDAGAGIDAPGGVIAGGTPLRDATAFGNEAAARRLVERGARVSPMDAANLGRLDLLRAYLDASSGTDPAELNALFWSGCHGGRLEVARHLHGLGADPNWIPPWETTSPLDAAARQRAVDVIAWLHSLGARTASDLRGC